MDIHSLLIAILITYFNSIFQLRRRIYLLQQRRSVNSNFEMERYRSSKREREREREGGREREREREREGGREREREISIKDLNFYN